MQGSATEPVHHLAGRIEERHVDEVRDAEDEAGGGAALRSMCAAHSGITA
jgi:hypothetical protein